MLKFQRFLFCFRNEIKKEGFLSLDSLQNCPGTDQIDRSSQIIRKKAKPQLRCGFFNSLAQHIMRAMIPFDGSERML